MRQERRGDERGKQEREDEEEEERREKERARGGHLKKSCERREHAMVT